MGEGHFDTTTAQGKCFVTIMGALNEFEREQTSERTKLVLLARGERGLWHAGPVLGYDRPADKKGHLIPNPTEANVVNAAFDAYLECGSIVKACHMLNAKLKQGLPTLQEQERAMKGDLAAIRAKADQLLEQYEERRRQVEDALARLTIAIEDIRRDAIDVTIARKLFEVIQEIFAEHVKAYQKRALVQCLLTRIEFSERRLKVAIRTDRLADPVEVLNGLPAGQVPPSAVPVFNRCTASANK